MRAIAATSMLTDAEWRESAEAFGITDAELQDYKQAFADLGAVGLDAFIDLLYLEVRLALANAPADEASVRRIMARQTVMLVALETVTDDALLAHSGPMH